MNLLNLLASLDEAEQKFGNEVFSHSDTRGIVVGDGADGRDARQSRAHVGEVVREKSDVARPYAIGYFGWKGLEGFGARNSLSVPSRYAQDYLYTVQYR